MRNARSRFAVAFTLGVGIVIAGCSGRNSGAPLDLDDADITALGVLADEALASGTPGVPLSVQPSTQALPVACGAEDLAPAPAHAVSAHPAGTALVIGDACK